MVLKGIFLLVFVLFVAQEVSGCRKVPPFENYSRRTRGDNGYRLIIGGEPNGYEPGKIYNLFLLGSRTHLRLQQFTHFMLSVQASSTPNLNTAIFSMASPKRVGRFQLFGDSLTTFNEKCVNTVSEADDLPKTEIQVMWVAPASGSGCVALSAMVYENQESWFSDDGGLTKIICEGKPTRQSIAGECCACDDAKYNFVFQGIWSNETHPKDYPFAVWLTHFSDVIGATHETNFSFWGENHIATDGFRNLAEWGSVRSLEVELRAKGSKLRSLIKAAGLWYPNVNTNTSSHFRVDRKHPKMSLVSMFGPSPDWVVGVNGLNLCQEDCSWKDSLNIDLFPWDAGTDNGITYMSPNSETQPRERMHRITTMYPEDPRAPFYNPTGKEMVPLAKLYIRKERNIPRGCDDEFLQAQLDVSENTEETSRPECETTGFSEWTPCSVTCGKGIRMRNRQYRNPEKASMFQCNRQLVSKEMCVADIPECEGGTSEDDEDENLGAVAPSVDDDGEGVGVCRTTSWSSWSECTASCGVGISMRTRSFIDHKGRKKCPHITIVEKQKCMMPECSLSDIEIPDPMCPVTQWSDWSPCSATCGSGLKVRTRLFLGEPSLKQKCESRLQMAQSRNCTDRPDCILDPQIAREVCLLSLDAGPCRGAFTRYGYVQENGRCSPFTYGGCRGNQNNFAAIEDCQRSCESLRLSAIAQESTSTARTTAELTTPDPGSLPVDCVLSEWTPWSPCNVSCGSGHSEKRRFIIQEGLNGGAECPKRVIKRKRCIRPEC
ncbi:spondin-1 [Phlebotomus papatasi]|uniref:spondin-1 n=1 Tax=Phlebotomus papatasi TaxID=29031 RepID=UPI0024841AF8|nr:spondin-1 [Phlebotomus papatasi]